MPLEQPLEPIISLYAFYTRQTTPLQKIGYSPKEAFWIHFACLPFLSWDDQAENEIRLSQLFGLYLGIYSAIVDGDIKPKERPAFIKLLEKRYEKALVPTSTEGSLQSALELGRFALPDQNDSIKCTHAGLTVLKTKRKWEQQNQAPIPCKLVQDV